MGGWLSIAHCSSHRVALCQCWPQVKVADGRAVYVCVVATFVVLFMVEVI